MSSTHRHPDQGCPLAVVGMACRFPGADSLEAYWRLISEQRIGYGPLDAALLDRELYFDSRRGVLGKSYTEIGGVVDFDAAQWNPCGLSDELMAGTDIAHLALLAVVHEAILHAGSDPADWKRSRTGTFLGHSRGSLKTSELLFVTHGRDLVKALRKSTEFAKLPAETRRRSEAAILDRLASTYPLNLRGRFDWNASRAATLVAEVFDLDGPALVVDAACASSLVALHLAAESLRHRRVDQAIVGGSSYSAWTSLVLFSQAHAVSPTGSFPFDARADGFVSSDGYAAVLLKRLDDAVAAGDRILGVIRGIGVSSDGKGKSLWAPRKEGQIAAIQRAYPQGLSSADLDFIEAHGTSTQVGDATELEALAETIGRCVDPGRRIPIQSVKANIGHTRETAGLAGLIKVLLALQHEQIPATTNFETPNPSIPWDSMPFFPPREATVWKRRADGRPRRAALDAFGIGGLNVHVALDDGGADSIAHNGSTSKSGSRVLARAIVPVSPASRSDAQPAMAPIAVIGLGTIFCGARTTTALADLFRTGRDPLQPIPADRWSSELYVDVIEGVDPRRWRGGFITDFQYDWRKHKVPPRQLEFADPLQFMVLDAAEQALNSAGYSAESFDGARCATIVGTEFRTDFGVQLTLGLRSPEFARMLRDALREQGLPAAEAAAVAARYQEEYVAQCPALYDETGSYTSSTIASRITKTFNLMGGAYSIDAGACSSPAALMAAIDQLRSGACDAVLCAGAQRSLDVCSYLPLALGARSTAVDEARPTLRNEFDWPGEGAAVVLLKRLDDALRDGNPVRGVLRGVGVSRDGGRPSAAVQSAVSRALVDAAASPEHLTCIVTAVDLPMERAGLAESLADQPGPVWVDTAARQLGHTGGAAGLAAMSRALLAFDERRLFPSTDASAERWSAQGPLRQTQEPVPLPVGEDLAGTNMGVSSLSPQGMSYQLILQMPQASPVRPASQEPGHRRTVANVYRVGGRNAADVQAELRYLIDASGPPPQRAGFSKEDIVRVAVVTAEPSGLRGAWSLALKALQNPATRPVAESQGVFVGESPSARPRLAFLFSGQGSQYAGMLRPLLSEVPAARQELDRINMLLADLNIPRFETLAWEEGDQLGRDLFRTQLSVLLADVLLDRIVRGLGINPDVIASHSFGEYAALVSSGAWTLPQAIELTRARCAAIERGTQRPGGMWATSAPRTELLRQIQALRLTDSAFIANSNAPDQTVVSAEQPAGEALADVLTGMGFLCKRLPVPAPFHSPLMAGVGPWLLQATNGLALRPPHTPLLSSVSNRYVADPDELRSNLAAQLERPVEFIGLIERLRADGVTLFLEVGPSQVLTKLTNRILAVDASGPPATAAYATDHPKSGGVESLLRLLAWLEVRGGTPASEAAGVGASHAPQWRAGLQGPAPVFDATAKRRERLRREGRTPHPVDGVRPASPVPSRVVVPAQSGPPDELEQFLIDFVCEQTGYPPELVGLDADLEAELGIDSIRKAQLLGELREHFPIQPTSDLSLDDFPTLRHVAAFIRQSELGTATARQLQGDAEPERRSETAPSVAASPQPTAASANFQALSTSREVLAQRKASPIARPRSTAEELLNVRLLCGSPREIGFQHAAADGDAIRSTMRRFLEVVKLDRIADGQLDQHAEAHRDFLGSDGILELEGMAAATGLPLGYFVMFNFGLVLPVMELLPGCTQLASRADVNGDIGLVHAVNEDWNLGRLLTGAFRRIAQVRRPDAGIPHLVFSACGQLGGMNGVNAAGLAVSSTLLLDRLPPLEERSTGILHFPLVQQILQHCSTIDEAVAWLRERPRGPAWSMCLSEHARDRVCYLEYDADSVQVRDVDDEVYSTNHCLLNSGIVETPGQSEQRYARVRELLHSGRNGAGRLSVESAQRILRDQFDARFGRETPHPTKWTIRQPDTQLSLVMRPAAHELWATADTATPTDPHRFHRLDLRDLFARAEARARESDAPPEQSGVAAWQTRPDRVMNRYVTRWFDAPLAAPRGRALTGRVLLAGDPELTEGLRSALQEQGLDVVLLPAGRSLESAAKQVDAVWDERPVSHLVLAPRRMPTTDDRRNLTDWEASLQQDVHWPFFVCQRWLSHVQSAGLTGQSTLAGLITCGADVPSSGACGNVWSGGLAGLFRSVAAEHPGLRVKLVDSLGSDPLPLVARRFVEELTAADEDLEVAYPRGRRRVPRLIVQPWTSPPDSEPDAGVEPTQGGVWIATGGARGVTAVIARELARRYGLRLHLLGTSPRPTVPMEWTEPSVPDRRALRSRVTREARQRGEDPVVAWRRLERDLELAAGLRQYAAEGIAAEYHACDVSDGDQLAAVIDRIRSAGEPIRGIIHGAGIESSCRFDKKTADGVRRTLAVKVGGAANLLALTSQDPLEFVIGFGSIAGRLGNVGQTDYATASDLLSKYLTHMQRARPQTRFLTVHWPAWDEVGMAVRPESRLAIELSGHRLMPTSEGAAHLVDELQHGTPESEVALLDHFGGVPSGRGWPSLEQVLELTAQQAEVAAAPLLTGVLESTGDSTLTAEIRFDPQREPFLLHHRFHRVPIFPVVAAMEAMLESAALLTGRTPRGLSGVEVRSAWRLHRGTPESARIECRRDQDDVDCRLIGDFCNSQGVLTEPSRCFVDARVSFADRTATPAVAWREPVKAWTTLRYDSESERCEMNAVWHGEVFQGLQRVQGLDRVLLGEILAPPIDKLLSHCPPEARWRSAPAVLDACLQACSILTWVRDKSYYLPWGMERVDLVDLPHPGEILRVIVELREQLSDRAVFDFALFGADRRLLASVTGYRGARVSPREGTT